MAGRRGPGMLLAIGIFKFIKAAALLTVGIAALSLAHHAGTYLRLQELGEHLRFGPDNRWIHRALGAISGLDTRKLDELGLGTFVYAAVFLVEGVGLVLRRHWAEYLTVVVTASFVPFEIYELVERATVLRVVGLLGNVLIAGYLLARLLPLRARAESRPA